MSRKKRWSLWGSVFIISLLLSAPVRAHSWYPQECCSGVDCDVATAEILTGPQIAKLFGGTSANANPLGNMVVTNKHGTVIVPPNFPRRASKDGKLHACIAKSDGTKLHGDAEGRLPFGTPYLRCIFLPPAM